VTSPFGFQDADNDRVPDFNADGFQIYTSRIENAQFSITQTYEYLKTGIGIAQGLHPKAAEDPGANATSNQYVLKHTYRVTNRTDAPLRGVRLYQFLHGLHSTSAVFDDNNYDEPSMCLGVKCSDYRYDVTLTGRVRAFVDLDRPFDDVDGEPHRATDVTDLFGFVREIDDAFFRSLLGKSEQEIEAAFRGVRVIPAAQTIEGIARSELFVLNTDVVSAHSKQAPIGIASAEPPFGWEVGRYGERPADNHIEGKPSVGVHLSVEKATLSGTDVFRPDSKWVAGAQMFDLGDLNPSATATFEVLLSISTEQSVTERPGASSAARPEPGTAPSMLRWRRPR
jgi:hypothetical protein